MKLQVDIPKEINKKLKIEKIKRENKTLQETLIEILKEYFNENKKNPSV